MTRARIGTDMVKIALALNGVADFLMMLAAIDGVASSDGQAWLAQKGLIVKQVAADCAAAAREREAQVQALG